MRLCVFSWNTLVRLIEANRDKLSESQNLFELELGGVPDTVRNISAEQHHQFWKNILTLWQSHPSRSHFESRIWMIQVKLFSFSLKKVVFFGNFILFCLMAELKCKWTTCKLLWKVIMFFCIFLIYWLPLNFVTWRGPQLTRPSGLYSWEKGDVPQSKAVPIFVQNILYR